MSSEIIKLLSDIDRIHKTKALIDNQLIIQAFDKAHQSYQTFLNSMTIDNLNVLLNNDNELAQLLETKYYREDNEILSMEIISGNVLREKIYSNEAEIALQYSQIRYIINYEFAEPQKEINQVLGTFGGDFASDSIWFVLYENGLIVSVLCYLGSRIPTDNSTQNDNLQSFATRRNRGKYIFRAKGYNQIVIKYASQYIKLNTNCVFLKLGVEHYNLYLVDVYRKVGFELMAAHSKKLWDKNDKTHIYMKYICSSYDTITFKLPQINTGPMVTEPFEFSEVIKWGSLNNNKLNHVEGDKKFKAELNNILCDGTYPDKSRTFGSIDCNAYMNSLNRSLTNAKNTFDILSNDVKLNLYNEAKNLATVMQYNGTVTYHRINIVKSKDNGIYKVPVTMSEGYKSSYYMNETEYNTNNNEIKKLVAKRYYIIKQGLENTMYKGISLNQGIQKWRDAFYDLRFVYIRNLRNLINKKLNHAFINKRLNEINNTDDEYKTLNEIKNLFEINHKDTINKHFSILTIMESIFFDCLHPHCYYKMDYLCNKNKKDLYLDYLNKQGDYLINLQNSDNDGPFFNVNLLREERDFACDRNSLGANNINNGIQSVYILNWDYESFLGMIGHEIMHFWFAGEEAEKIYKLLFSDFYGWIDNLSKTHKNIYTGNVQKYESIADISSFQIMSILLKHSSLDWQKKLTFLKKAVSGICNTGADHDHPPGNYRINTLICIPYIHEIMVKNNIGQ